MKTLVLVIALLLPVAAAAQTNPCTTAAPTGTELNPTKVVATLPEHAINEADGGPRVSHYALAYFLPPSSSASELPATTTAAVAPVTIPKASWTLVSGTTDCYQATLPAPVIWTGGWPLVAGVKAVRTARPTLVGAESPYRVSNPFATAPTVLSSPGLVLIRQ